MTGTKINYYNEPFMKDGPGFTRLKRHPRYAEMVARTLEEQRKALEEVARPPVLRRNRRTYRRYPEEE